MSNTITEGSNTIMQFQDVSKEYQTVVCNPVAEKRANWRKTSLSTMRKQTYLMTWVLFGYFIMVAMQRMSRETAEK